MTAVTRGLLPLLLLLLLLPSVALAEPIYFEGTFSPADTASYERLEFEVPEGTTHIHVMYDYTVDGEQGSLLRNVVDLGVYDPEHFRGWSGSEREAVTVSIDAEATTPGYLAGPIPAGPWTVELGVGLVADDTLTSWTVTISLMEAEGTEFTPPEHPAVVLGGMGWYDGDLHSHTVHSDGSPTVAELFAAAHDRGLDFLAVSDHNTYAGHYELPALQDQYEDLLLMRGVEITTYRGHANAFGMTESLDYHASEADYSLDMVLHRLESSGGLFSVNHPDQIGYTNAGGTYTTLGWAVEGTDWSRVTGFEVLNGATTWEGLSNPFNVEALAHYDELLAEGYRLTAVGGSDDHKGGTGTAEDLFYGPVGTPTTVVFADELSEAAILDGIRAGHVYLKANGPDGPDLYLEATCGETAWMMGDEAAGPSFTLLAHAVGADELTLRVIQDGVAIDEIDVQGDDFEATLDVVPDDRSAVRLELRDDDLIVALTNPVYLTYSDAACPADVGDDDDDDDDSTVPQPDDDGCECRVAPTSTSSAAILLVGLLAAAVIRRR